MMDEEHLLSATVIVSVWGCRGRNCDWTRCGDCGSRCYSGWRHRKWWWHGDAVSHHGVPLFLVFLSVLLLFFLHLSLVEGHIRWVVARPGANSWAAGVAVRGRETLRDCAPTSVRTKGLKVKVMQTCRPTQKLQSRQHTSFQPCKEIIVKFCL